MSTTDNTKIELVSEAIEGLVAASVAGQVQRLTGSAARRQFELVQDARTALADSLRLLLKPTLRVVSSNQSPSYRMSKDEAALCEALNEEPCRA